MKFKNGYYVDEIEDANLIKFHIRSEMTVGGGLLEELEYGVEECVVVMQLIFDVLSEESKIAVADQLGYARIKKGEQHGI
jgi:hypothetical protein